MFEGFTKETVKTSETTINLVRAGKGPPLLLLHGYPQSHVIWHKIAPRLAENFTVVATDLRGYGDSGKPASDPDHAVYSKRATARDQVEVMERLGYKEFFLTGHDRGGRVAHRLVLDHPERVRKWAVLDIVPTHKIFATTNRAVATGYYHWFFLIQPNPFPERLLGADPEYYIRTKLTAWGAGDDAFTPEAMAEYIRCFRDPAVIHASCEDYRAAASIDLEHDEADMATKVQAPLLVLWGAKGLMEKYYDVPETWRERAEDVQGRKLDCGHFLPEEKPDETLAELLSFFADA